MVGGKKVSEDDEEFPLAFYQPIVIQGAYDSGSYRSVTLGPAAMSLLVVFSLADVTPQTVWVRAANLCTAVAVPTLVCGYIIGEIKEGRGGTLYDTPVKQLNIIGWTFSVLSLLAFFFEQGEGVGYSFLLVSMIMLVVTGSIAWPLEEG